MKKLINIRLLMLICLIISAGLATVSCDKDSSSPDKIELLSFGPAGVKIGDTISIIGNNLDRVTAIKFTGGDSIPLTSFINQNSGLIKVKIPEHAERGPITLTSKEGNITSKAVIDFNVVVTIDNTTLSAFLKSTTVRPGDIITVNGTQLNYIKEVAFEGVSIRDTNFVSRSLTQIKFKVPNTAKTGTLTFKYAGTSPSTITTDDNLTVLLPTFTSFSPALVARGSNLTITGKDLDLTMGILFNGVSDTIKEFVSKTATQIVVKVPDKTILGAVSLITYSKVPITSSAKLHIVGDITLDYAFFEDYLDNKWQSWSWDVTLDFANTEQVRNGSKAIKATCAGKWGALYLGGSSVSTTGYSALTFSVYGGTGTDGKTLQVMLNWGTAYMATIQEGKWTDIDIPLSSLGSPASITDVILQVTGWTGSVYIDRIGLK